MFDEKCKRETPSSIRSTVVGTAKVMSYEDISAAGQKRDAKDKVKDNDKNKAKGQSNRRKAPSTQPAEVKRPRLTEANKAEQEIAAWGLTGYCTVL